MPWDFQVDVHEHSVVSITAKVRRISIRIVVGWGNSHGVKPAHQPLTCCACIANSAVAEIYMQHGWELENSYCPYTSQITSVGMMHLRDGILIMRNTNIAIIDR